MWNKDQFCGDLTTLPIEIRPLDEKDIEKSDTLGKSPAAYHIGVFTPLPVAATMPLPGIMGTAD